MNAIFKFVLSVGVAMLYGATLNIRLGYDFFPDTVLNSAVFLGYQLIFLVCYYLMNTDSKRGKAIILALAAFVGACAMHYGLFPVISITIAAFTSLYISLIEPPV